MPVDQIVGQLQKTAASYGLVVGDLRMNYNTRLIQELGIWAQEKGKGQAFKAEGFRAYFVENVNVYDIKVLMELAERVGLDGAEAKNVLETGQYSSVVDADWGAAGEMEIVAAPTYIVGEDRLVGAQPYENLEELAVKNGAEKIHSIRCGV